MRYSKEDYAKAFNSLAKSGVSEEVIVSGLLRVIRANGDQSRASKIVTEIEKELIKGKGERRVICEVARDVSSDLKEEIIRSLKSDDHIEFVLNPELVAGTRLTFNGELELDKSFVGKLKKCFVN